MILIGFWNQLIKFKFHIIPFQNCTIFFPNKIITDQNTNWESKLTWKLGHGVGSFLKHRELETEGVKWDLELGEYSTS